MNKTKQVGSRKWEIGSKTSRRASLLPSDFRTPTFSRGFTLIELLVVVVIMLVLTAITVAAINITIDGDKVRSGARQIQSYLEGARTRASDAKAPRGVRFILDPANPRTVSSIVYIAPTDVWKEGQVILERPDGDNDGNPDNNGDTSDDSTSNNMPAGSLLNFPPYNDSADEVFVLRGFDGDGNPNTQDTNWKDLYDRGLLRTGNRIRIPAGDNGKWYTIDTRLLAASNPLTNNPPVRLLLQSAERRHASSDATLVEAFNRNNPPTVNGRNYSNAKYELELTPSQLANQEPVQLPKNVVVHLDRSSSDPDGLLDPDGTAPFTPSRNPALRGNRLPNSWKYSPSTTVPPNPAGFDYTQYCDIMFSPRGSVTGPEASAGLIHLYVGEQKDADRDKTDWAFAAPASGNWTAPEFLSGVTASDPTGEAYQRGDKFIVSIFTRTGSVSVNPVYANPDGSDNVSQRFRFSETGEVAGR